MSYMAQLIDKRRALEASLYSVNMEIAMAQNQREDAQYWQVLHNAVIKARKAYPEGCFFLEQGDKDRVEMLARKAVAG
jgi:hypothetical protein